MDYSNITKNEAISLVSEKGSNLQILSDEYKNNFDVVLAAVVNDFSSIEFASEDIKLQPIFLLKGLEFGYYTFYTLPLKAWESKPFLIFALKVYGEELIDFLKINSNLLPLFFWEDSFVLTTFIGAPKGLEFVIDNLFLMNANMWLKPNILNGLSHIESFAPENIFDLIPKITSADEILNLADFFKTTKNKNTLDICLKKLKEVIPEESLMEGTYKFIKTKKEVEYWLEIAGSEAFYFVVDEIILNKRFFGSLLDCFIKDKDKASFVRNVVEVSKRFRKEPAIISKIIKYGLMCEYTENDLDALQILNRFLHTLSKLTIYDRKLMLDVVNTTPSINSDIIYNRLIEDYISKKFMLIQFDEELKNAIIKKREEGCINTKLWKNISLVSKLNIIK